MYPTSMLVLSSPISLLDLEREKGEGRQQLSFTDHLSDLVLVLSRAAKPELPSPEHRQSGKAHVAFYLLEIIKA